MFKFKSTRDQLMEERRKNEALKADLQKKESDIEYLAMMCEVELDTTTGEEVS